MLGVDAVDKCLEDAATAACIGANMDVAELYDAVAVEGLRQITAGVFYLYDLKFLESYVGAP